MRPRFDAVTAAAAGLCWALAPVLWFRALAFGVAPWPVAGLMAALGAFLACCAARAGP